MTTSIEIHVQNETRHVSHDMLVTYLLVTLCELTLTLTF